MITPIPYCPKIQSQELNTYNGQRDYHVFPLSKQQHNKSKRKRIARSISVTDVQNKPKGFNKVVGRNSDDQGRIYVPGSWIGKTVKVSLVE